MIAPEVWLILLGWAIAGGSPGPATLAISGTAMGQGRIAGLQIAGGIVLGSASWGIAAALGMSAVMVANAWLFEGVRYAGAAYLLFLALKSLRSALQPNRVASEAKDRGRQLLAKGFLIHITNPKAIFSWGAIYAVALPAGAQMAQVWQMFAALICVSMLVFFGYGILFSSPTVARGYQRMRRGFDLAFAGLFGAASVKILTARLEVT